MDQEFLRRAEELWNSSEAINRFHSRYGVFPPQAAFEVVRGFEELSDQIPQVDHPASLEELWQGELKRRLMSLATYWDHFLSGSFFSYPEVIAILGIEVADLAELEPWLKTHRTTAIEAVERKFATTAVKEYERPVDLNDPDELREADGVAKSEIGRFHLHLGKLMERSTRAGTYLRDMRAGPFNRNRSEFDWVTNKLKISIPDTCFVSADDTVQIRHRLLLELFGHEGMGHGLMKILTESRDDLPFFLKKGGITTIASAEAVTQFYEGIIFEALNQAEDIQRALRINHLWQEIYQDEQDSRLITEYDRSLFAWAITLLADPELGDPRDPQTVQIKKNLVAGLAINPLQATLLVDYHNRMSIDATGNLDFQLATELRYSAKSASRALEVFRQHGITYDGDGRSLIDLVFLTGYWTPTGFLQNAQLAAKKS